MTLETVAQLRNGVSMPPQMSPLLPSVPLRTAPLDMSIEVDKPAGNAASTSASASTSSAAAAPSGATAAVNGASEEQVKGTPEEVRVQLDILRKELSANLLKKQSIDRALASHESSIYAFETSYLSVDLSGGTSSATFGNIVKGYDAYLKTTGTGGASEAGRKKGATGSSTRGGGAAAAAYAGLLFQPVEENERIFSRSSATYPDSLQLRDRDAGVVTGSDGEGDQDLDEDDEDDSANASSSNTTNNKTTTSATATAAQAAGPAGSSKAPGASNPLKESHPRPDSGSSSSKDAKRTKRK